MTRWSAVAFVVASASGALFATAPRPAWNTRAAADYLEARQSWWQAWPRSARDHHTTCISCHTALPYALARPVLRDALHDTVVSAAERKMFDDVVTRVRAWNEVLPYYGDATPKGRERAAQARATEAVLNALVLASRDSRAGVVSADARHAFDNMFALQIADGEDAGAWPWLDFDLQPWEAGSAQYFGAALAAVAIGSEPRHFAQSPEIQLRMGRLRTYLRARVDASLWAKLRRRDDPAVLDRAMLLWASSCLPDLLSDDARRAHMAVVWQAQRGDGGWSLASLGTWQARERASLDTTSDGYATGLVAYALERAGSPADEPHLVRALAWLAQHQDAETGMWRASSLNKDRDPETDIGKFMSDAATAFAVLALAGR